MGNDASTALSAKLARLRREYAAGGLDEASAGEDPQVLFETWLAQAGDAGLHEPNAMVVSTVAADGTPSSRMVLLKGCDDRGLVFFTNDDSRKAGELHANPACALLFPWHPIERQVRIEGRAVPVSREETVAYFASRPRGSQLGAWASPQSAVVAGREDLDTRYAEVERRFGEDEVPAPDRWGGYRVRPDVVEFWQGRPGRMHDRIRFRRAGDGWVRERLAP